MLGRLRASASALMVFSDGYVHSNDRDPLSAVDSWNRIDLRFAISPPEGNWEAAIYGRNITDERVTVGGAGGIVNRTLALDYDADGLAHTRGSRWGIQLGYFFGQ